VQELLDHVWSEKYRPTEVEDLIATKEVKALVNGILSKKLLGNLLLVGPPGIGKTTIARLLLEKLGFEYIIINASIDGNIDTLRNRIKDFASTISFSGTRKYVILDEADYLNAQSTQPALRNFIETFSKNCGFIFTANYENKIIEPLRSRLTTERFPVPKAQYPKLALDFTRRMQKILEAEGVEYDFDTLGAYVMKTMPNWRSIINHIQDYAQRYDKIDTGLLGTLQTASLAGLIKPLFKDKNFGEVRKWVANTIDNDAVQIYTTLAEGLVDLVVEQSVGDLIIIIARYQYQSAFVADQQVNLSACLAEIMATCLVK